MPSRGSYNLGSLRGIGSSTRMYNSCRQTSPAPWSCIDQFTENPPPLTVASLAPLAPPIPDPGKMKTVFLLQLTGTTNFSIKNTLNYYWNTYPQEFIKCPIEDTQGSLEITLQLLDKYYNSGYRYFVGFQTSTIMSEVLNSEWFNFHPDAIGITPSANSNSLNIPKNIYRMLADNSYIINSISTQINDAISGGYNIYYIYTLDQLVGIDALKIINKIIGTYTNYKTLGTTFPELDTPTIIQNFLNDPPNGIKSSSDILITLLLNRRQYINLYNVDLYTEPLFFSGQQYDILATTAPIISSGSQIALSNKYNISLFKGVNTSVLWRNGYKTLGSTNYSTVTLNILNLLNQFANNNLLNNINSHYGILQFDPVTKDILYPNILLQQYNGSEFVSTNLYIENPIIGSYSATFTNPAPELSIIATPSYQPYGKAIALFELSINPNPVDPTYRDSLYYFWYKNNSFPKFPIIDTEGDINKTIDLLEAYYNQGYRIFLGFSRSSVLTAVVSWFNAHPLAVGISLWSSATSLKNVSRNIYRTIPSDDAIVNAVLPYLPKQPDGNVFYIYTKGELSPEETLIILESQSELNIIPYAVDPNISLTAIALQTFFDDNNASDKDVVVLELFDDKSYFDLYNDELNFPGKQYDIINSNLPSINGTIAQEKLNDKLFYIKNQYSNTSLLFRENADYLTARSGGDIYITSAGLSNALNMIDYFLKGKNVGLLGSFSAVLQFNTFNDIQFPSFLFRVYKMLYNKFVPNHFVFDDPLLGSFQADFV